MKEDLFNILSPYVKDALFLDLYCGSGAIGIEALSRGAKNAVFVDSSKEAITATELNLRKTRLEDRAEVLHMSVRDAENLLAGRVFDIIFMDPPYDSGIVKVDLSYGILVVECPLDATLGEPYQNEPYQNEPYRRKEFSGKQFVFYKGSDGE